MRRLSVAAVMTILMMASCQTKDNKVNKSKVMDNSKEVISENEMKQKEGTLDSLLNIRREAFTSTKPKEIVDLYAAGIAEIVNSGILEKALNIGDKAPNFSLKNPMGETVSLYQELKEGPIILTWYRGGWCPYCNINLSYLQERLPDFQKKGAQLFALTPELPDKSLSTSEKHKLEFEVLSDVGNKIAKQYGLVFELMPKVAEVYQKGFDLHGFNGDESNELPIAATYLIDTKGVIQYAFLDADYRNRAEPDEVLAALDKLSVK